MGEQVAAGSKRKKTKNEKRGRSSAGRAPALQAGGQEFESLRLHCEDQRRPEIFTLGMFQSGWDILRFYNSTECKGL